MYRSASHAVWAMVRWRERRRAAKAAPFPDHKPKGVSTADKWAYLHVSPTHGCIRPEPDDDRDPETVMVLFDRYNRYRYLTRIFIEGQDIERFAFREQGRAWRTMVRFTKALCARGLLDSPPDCCPKNLQSKFPVCRPECALAGDPERNRL
ncbi:MAG: hypothetical protein M0Z38_02595, partial [Deltaproteobacteria bacterium]|nr:hypothetical protein [Deltaproteobacteria bacterium]